MLIGAKWASLNVSTAELLAKAISVSKGIRLSGLDHHGHQLCRSSQGLPGDPSTYGQSPTACLAVQKHISFHPKAEARSSMRRTMSYSAVRLSRSPRTAPYPRVSRLVGSAPSLANQVPGARCQTVPKDPQDKSRSSNAFSLTPRLANTWVSQLMQVQGMSEEMAKVVAERYKSPFAMMEASQHASWLRFAHRPSLRRVRRTMGCRCVATLLLAAALCFQVPDLHDLMTWGLKWTSYLTLPPRARSDS